MNRYLMLLLLASAVTLPTHAQDKHGDSHAPRHGGVVVETKAADLEACRHARLDTALSERPRQAHEVDQRERQADRVQRQRED